MDRKIEIESGEKRTPHVTISDSSKQMALITAINGNTLTVTPPLIWSFSPNPVVLYSFIGIIQFVGLEDMKVDHEQGRSGASFMIDQCYGCWVRGMYSYKPGGYHTFIVDSLRGEHELTVVATMHDLTLAGQYGDRVALLHAGRLHASGPAADVLTEETLNQIYGARVRVIEGDDGPIVVPVR